MPRKIARKTLSQAHDVALLLRQFLTLKLQTEALEERLSDVKRTLSDIVESSGYADPKGSYYLDLEEPVTVDGYGTCTQLKRQIRVTQSLDAAAAEALLQQKGLYEEATTQITVVDEEKLEKLVFKGLISDDEFDRIYPKKVSYAFIPVKG